MKSPPTYRILVDARAHQLPWRKLRSALWPEVPQATHIREIASAADDPAQAAFLATDQTGEAVALAEAAIRHDYVNGCETTPVVFLEGIYVAPAHRRRGIARRLCAAVEAWAILQGCLELASDADLGNVASQHMHRALGFAETERVVFFRRLLQPKP